MGINVRIVSEGDIWRMDILILVTLGTNDKSFVRLIKRIEDLVIQGMIQEEVVIQAGYTKYESKYLKIFDLIAMEKFNELMETCNLLITHGGVGTIISGLKNGKKVIAVPRLQKYGEHVNDHQLQIIENFSEAGYVLAAYDVGELDKTLQKVGDFEAKQYTSNTQQLIRLVKEHIDR